MAVVLGIDVGTSSVKGMLLDTEKGVCGIKTRSYGVDIPYPGYAQQDPELWWNALKEVLGWLRSHHKKDYENIAAIGYSGQMHGLVAVGADGQPVRSAVIWLDQRSKKQLEEIRKTFTEDEMGVLFANQISSGFAFPSLLWIRENEPENFGKIRSIFCPKDYLRLKMTGRIGTDVTDASSTGMFSIEKRDWCWEAIKKFQLPEDIFPPVMESCDIAGTVTGECSRETGLPAGIPVVAGSGDQQAQSIGNGVCRPGTVISNIGTGGQISAFIEKPIYDKRLRTNTFCHAIKNAYTIFGATLCSGMSMNWAKNKIFQIDDYDTVNQMAASVAPGSDGLIYLPYLSGERTPHMDPNAKGMFFGMMLGHERAHFLRAVMEGVTYSLKECMEIIEDQGVEASEIIASGGGAASEQWLQIQADIFGKPVNVSKVKEQACLGSCILAAAGTSVLPSVEEGCERFVSFREKVFLPDRKNQKVYENGYRKYKELYKRLWDLMRE